MAYWALHPGPFFFFFFFFFLLFFHTFSPFPSSSHPFSLFPDHLRRLSWQRATFCSSPTRGTTTRAMKVRFGLGAFLGAALGTSALDTMAPFPSSSRAPRPVSLCRPHCVDH